MTTKTTAPKTADKTASTTAPDARDTTTDEPVTELAQIDGTEINAELKEMSGATDKDASTQQKDALDGLKQARDTVKDPSKAPEPMPFASGPGSDIA